MIDNAPQNWNCFVAHSERWDMKPSQQLMLLMSSPHWINDCIAQLCHQDICISAEPHTRMQLWILSQDHHSENDTAVSHNRLMKGLANHTHSAMQCCAHFDLVTADIRPQHLRNMPWNKVLHACDNQELYMIHWNKDVSAVHHIFILSSTQSCLDIPCWQVSGKCSNSMTQLHVPTP